MSGQIPFKRLADEITVGDAVEVIRTNLALLVGQMESVNRQMMLGTDPRHNVQRVLTANQVSLCDVHSAIAKLSNTLRRNAAS